MTAEKYNKSKDGDNHNDSEEKEQKLSICSTICFGMGGAPAMLCNTAINFYISIFVLEIVKLQPYEVSIILFSGKFWDALTDPVVGYLVSRSPCHFRGRLKPWILFSSPIACAWYFLLWYVPEIPREAYLPWYLMCYCLFQTFMTTFQVPYTSLTMYLSSSQKERDRATAVRVFVEVVAIVVSVSVQGQLISLARTGGAGCVLPSNNTNATLFNTTTLPDDENISAQKKLYMLSSIIFCALYCISGLCVFLGVTEQEGSVHEKPEPFFTSIKLVFKHRPYVLLVVTCLFIFLANSIVQGNIALYLTHSVDLGDSFANVILVLLCCSIVSIPGWHFISNRYGKKIAFGAGIIVQMPVLGSLFVIPGNLYVAYALSVLAGIGLSVTFFLPWSMLPDTLDEYMVKMGNRKDTIFYSFFVFLYKLASGVSLALSQLILEAGGYDSTLSCQPKSVGHTLRFLLAPIPVFLYILGLVALYKYPINQHTREKTRQLLEARNVTEENGKSSTLDLKGKEIESFDNPAYVTEGSENTKI